MPGRRLAKGLVAVLAALVLPASAQASDNRSAGGTLTAPAAGVVVNNTSYTTEAQEPNTAPGNITCPAFGSSVYMGHTAWYRFTGNGGVAIVDTSGSTSNGGVFDTVLVVYPLGSNTPTACNNDRFNLPPFLVDRTSRVSFTTTPGQVYEIQAGDHVGATNPTPWSLHINLTLRPPNDNKANAASLVSDTPARVDTSTATTESNENLTCDGHTYAKTAWYTLHTDSFGNAVFHASGTSNANLNTVLTVYDTDGTTVVGCNDDGFGSPGASRLVVNNLSPGDHLVQVGGFYTGSDASTAAAGPLEVDVSFNTEADHDHDGYNAISQGGPDCNDNDPAINPGAAEVANNNVDENCDGVFAYDRDGDGAVNYYSDADGTQPAASPPSTDCDDNSATAHPGATEVANNTVDEDCDGTYAYDRDHDGFVNYFSDAAGTHPAAAPASKDCNDNEATAHAGAKEKAGNTVDEDCDGTYLFDRDKDGSNAYYTDGTTKVAKSPKSPDCNDAKKSIHPGAHDIPGNKVDENCNGKDAKKVAVNVHYTWTGTYTSRPPFDEALAITLTGSLKGATVRVTCKGHGCPKAFTLRPKSNKALKITRQLVRHFLAPGAVLKVKVTKPEFFGREFSWSAVRQPRKDGIRQARFKVKSRTLR